MSLFKERVDVSNFSIEEIDTTEIDRVASFLPKNGIIDINIAEKALAFTLEGQNLCQERITQVDRWIGMKEAEKNRAWSKAALTKAKASGLKTVKEKEWFAQSDDDYIEACNNLSLAKACKKWFENKANYFQTWHYAIKTFLRRDYSIENIGSVRAPAYNNTHTDASHVASGGKDSDEDWGEFSWE